jgi:hypothetical protein
MNWTPETATTIDLVMRDRSITNTMAQREEWLQDREAAAVAARIRDMDSRDFDPGMRTARDAIRTELNRRNVSPDIDLRTLTT